MKALPLVLCLILSTLAVTLGGTITVNSNSAFSVRDSNGDLISGGAIRVGFLNLESPGALIVENATNLQQIEPFLTPLAEGTDGGGRVLQSGNSGQTLVVNDQFGVGDFFGQITDSSSLSQGTKLFLWLFNHPVPSEATEWAIVSSTNNSWTVPNSIGATTLSTGSIDEIYRGVLTDSELRLEPIDSPSGFDAWTVDNFNPSQLSGTEANETADPDGDDWTNLMEYAFGTDPLQANTPSERFRLATNTSGELALIFQPVENRDDVRISAFTSTDLQIWSPATANETAPNVFEVLLPQDDQGFAQLQFTREF